MKNKLLGILFLLVLSQTYGQRSSKVSLYLTEPKITDSLSTLIIPVSYNANLLASSKVASWNDFYANIIFYDFVKDSSKKLFEKDTYIQGFTDYNNSYNRYDLKYKEQTRCENWIFYFVKPSDSNKSGRIDHNDPSILYVSDRKGNNLKSLTNEENNAMSIDVFDKQGFALIKMQRDLDQDGEFEYDDKDFFYIRLDLKTLTLGNRIEIKN